jgi:hypothetical protein
MLDWPEAFAQVRRSSNIQLLLYSLVTRLSVVPSRVDSS